MVSGSLRFRVSGEERSLGAGESITIKSRSGTSSPSRHSSTSSAAYRPRSLRHLSWEVGGDGYGDPLFFGAPPEDPSVPVTDC